jgi:hypothetical protein
MFIIKRSEENVMKKSQQRIMRELTQPFRQEDIEFRPQQVGYRGDRPYAMIMAYVTNRAIQTRLDKTVGCMNWKNEFHPLPNSVGEGALCGLSIKFNGEWVTKYDGADNTGMEATKGGLSGAMKRAAVEWGIGRYLYDIPTMFADCITPEQYQKMKHDEREAYTYAQTKDKKTLYWKPKPLEKKFLPQAYVSKSIIENIKKLIEETNTKENELLEYYGIDDIRDLFSHEAASAVRLLVERKNRQQEDDNEQ